MNPKKNVLVTGMGVITPIGIGLEPFTRALKEGKTNFSIGEWEHGGRSFHFPIAKVDGFDFRNSVREINAGDDVLGRAKRLRHVSQSSLYGIRCALEAWVDARLNEADTDRSRIAIVSGGSNTQQASVLLMQEEYREKLQFLNPNYGLNFFDTDLVGLLSELLGITGEGHSVAAASASGNMAIIQAHRLIASNEYDVAIVVAPMMELSIYEFQGFTALGAMAGADKFPDPQEICRPFDEAHGGFVYGQSSGCLILESETHAARRGREAYGSIAGYGICLDANRKPDPSMEGEKKAMLMALERSGIAPEQIGYVNTHGTASVIGDKTEAGALQAAGLECVKANSTKSLTGHGLSAAGVVEAIATLVQMKEGFLHRSHNLVNPISDKIGWIRSDAEPANIRYALSNSFGFGGINTSIIIKKLTH
jgi:malonyl-ACP decarboxylase